MYVVEYRDEHFDCWIPALMGTHPDEESALEALEELREGLEADNEYRVRSLLRTPSSENPAEPS